MNFYEILKTKKLGRGSPDYWTQLFAEHVGGKGEWAVTEITGVLPITFRSNGTALIDYRIYGTADGAGVQTKNLFDKSFITTSYRIGSDGQPYPDARCSLSDFIPVESSTTYSKIGNFTYDSSLAEYSADKTFILRYVDGHGTVTTSATTKFVRASMLKSETDTYTFVKGSTPPETYIPFGYKLPLTTTSGTESKDTDIYIGDSKLLSTDYIDYESGKIYKAKRIHEDTVTIDGIVWDILDYDHDEVYKADGTRAKHTVTIQTHDIINELQYSARQAAFAFPNGLAAGTYHFTVGAHPWVAGDVNKMLTFTLANDIAAGGQLVFNGAYNTTLVDTTATIFASPTSTTAMETVTMSEGNTGTDLGTILRSKTDTVNSIDRAFLGNNNWLESAMRQYLNSDKPAGNVWTPQTVFDRPPVWETTTAGFLNEKSTNFISHIGTAKKTTGLNSISDGGRTAVNDEKIFLLSHSEVFMGDEYAGGEDTPYAYYKNYSDNQSASTGADSNRIKYRAGAAKYWWLRSPSDYSAYSIRLVDPSGSLSSSFANSAYSVAPACCIVLDDMDDWVKQTFYTEIDADLPAIETFNGTNTLDSTETLGEVTIKGQIKPQS